MPQLQTHRPEETRHPPETRAPERTSARRVATLAALALVLLVALVLLLLQGWSGAWRSPVPARTATLQPLASPSASPRVPSMPIPSPSAALDQGVIGRIIIPSIGIDAPVVEVSWHLEQIEGQPLAVWDVAHNAAGHHRGTSPLGGDGNCVISGHSRAADGAVFRDLSLILPDDQVILRATDGSERMYLVEQVRKVAELGASPEERQANAAYMVASEDATLTLITCWPDWAYTHRIIVVARAQ